MKRPEQQFAAAPPSADKKELQNRRSEEPYIVIGEQSVSYLGVEVPKGKGGKLVPGVTEFKEEYFYLEGHYQLMREVATALLLNKPILLEGGTGVYNKTTTIARMCRDLNMNYCKVNFDRETAREDVIGGHTLKVDAQGHESYEWYDGDLMYAIRYGGVAFLDEYNRQSKMSGIVNPIIDAILNGRKEITNPYNENERVSVHPDFRLVAAQNPAGFEEGHEYTDRSQLPAETFGRWIFKKLPVSYTEEEENKMLAGVIGEKVAISLPPSEFRVSGEGLAVAELAEVPGMTHWRKEIITILRVIEAKATGAKRQMAKGQQQKLYFNPRLIMGTIPQYIARFYNGDINQTVKNAFETCIIGMFSSEDDRQKIRVMLDQAAWKPASGSSKRRPLDPTHTGAPDKAPKKDLTTEADPSLGELGKVESELTTGIKAAREKAGIKTAVISVEHRTKTGKRKEIVERISLDLESQLPRFRSFYETNALPLPANFEESMRDIWSRNQEQIKKAMEEYGFDDILLIPATSSLPTVHTLTSKDYNPTYEGDNFKAGGSFAGVTEDTSKPRILLVHKKNAQNLKDHPILKETLNKPATDFSSEPLTLTDYLIYQRLYFQETGKHLDESGWTWCPGSKSGTRVVDAVWGPGGGRLRVSAAVPGVSDSDLGCRLSRLFS